MTDQIGDAPENGALQWFSYEAAADALNTLILRWPESISMFAFGPGEQKNLRYLSRFELVRIETNGQCFACDIALDFVIDSQPWLFSAGDVKAWIMARRFSRQHG